MTRIAIIGAGSVEFTRNIVADLSGFPELHGSITLALHDIDEERSLRAMVPRWGGRSGSACHPDPNTSFDAATGHALG